MWSLSELGPRCKGLWQRYKYSLLVVLVGAILLLIPTKGGEGGETVCRSTDSGIDLRETEQRLEQVLSQIGGAGRVTVMLTLKEGAYRIPAKDVSRSEEEQEERTVILSSGNGGEDVVFLRHIYPKYQGALVVCDGGGDPRVKLELLEAVRALTGLTTEKISICKRQ